MEPLMNIKQGEKNSEQKHAKVKKTATKAKGRTRKKNEKRVKAEEITEVDLS